MLYQTDIYTSAADISDVKSDISVKIHGAAMNAIPKEYAAEMHKKGYHPFSVFTVDTGSGLLIRVSALTDEARVIPETLSSLKSIRVYGAKEPIRIKGCESADPISASEGERFIDEKRCTLKIVTPAMIKTKGRPSASPDICGYFQSVVNKYNTFENEDISFEEFREAFENAFYGDFHLESTEYNVSGNIFPGTVGSCRLIFPKDKRQNTVLRRMLAYASYSGIGGKTGQGMGGVVIM